MTIHTHDDVYEPAHTASQTAQALGELQLYGYRPFDEPDPRPMPDGQRLAVAVADIFRRLRCDPRRTPAWTPRGKPPGGGRRCSGDRSTSSTAPRHGSSGRSMRTSRRSAAFSASRMAPRVKSTELERLTAEGLTLIETAQLQWT